MITILFLTANPFNTDRLRLDKEMRAIDTALRQSELRDQFDIRSHWAVCINDLQELFLRHQPNIMHFSGHGSDQGEIILEDNAGNGQPVSASALSHLFSILKDNIRCVVLNACYSQPQAQAIVDHVDCVVGMSGVISDDAALNFSTAFYRALGYGRSIQTAFDLGCSQVLLENLHEADIPKLLTTTCNPANTILVDARKEHLSRLTATDKLIKHTGVRHARDYIGSQDSIPGLCDILAQLYPDETTARRIVHDTGMDISNIPLTTYANHNWHVILQEARKTGLEMVLLDIILRGYSNNSPLWNAHVVHETSPSRRQDRLSANIEFDWITVRAGTFTMGEGNTQRRVYVPVFRIAKVPITNAQYAKFVDSTGYETPRHWQHGRIPHSQEEHPVVHISPKDALAFCEWANVVKNGMKCPQIIG